MTQEKDRLDVILVKQGHFQSRERAHAAIMSGCVYINNQKADKPGTKVPADIVAEIRDNTLPFVSRGGLKLAKALKVFGVDVSGLTALDAGASTGGFTDCLLKNGAARVIAVDVGYGQLAWELRNDPRVLNLERTNARYLTPADIGNVTVDVLTMDLAFISITKVIPAMVQLLSEQGIMLCLIKPQFEAGRDKVGKKGVVRDPSTHIEVIENILDFVEGSGFIVAGLDFSPITGPEGNIEYLLYCRRNIQSREQQTEQKTMDTGEYAAAENTVFDGEYITQLVSRAHQSFKE